MLGFNFKFANLETKSEDSGYLSGPSTQVPRLGRIGDSFFCWMESKNLLIGFHFLCLRIFILRL